jgi:excisionase family DNA binding protein
MPTSTPTFTAPATNGVPPAVVGVRAAAALLSAGERSVWRWIADGKLPAVRLPSGRVRIRVADLEEFLTPLTPSNAEPACMADMSIGEPASAQADSARRPP